MVRFIKNNIIITVLTKSHWFQSVGRRKKVIPVKFEIGDLVWVKFSRRPWWPSAVCVDPVLKIHTKMKGRYLDTRHETYCCLALY